MTSASAWAAVVVNHEAGDLLDRCVRSLLAAPDAPGELLIVDNASTDGSATAVAAAHPDVTVIHASTNGGYSRAANLGIAASTAAVVAVLNPDTEFEAGTARALLDRFDHEPDLGAAGPRVRNLDGTQYPSARSIPTFGDTVGHALFGLLWPGNRFTRRYRQLDADPDAARDVDWLSGSAIWLRRTALDDVGGWDERYFMYVEDVDLCWRLRRHGWRVAYEPAGCVIHVQGAVTRTRPYRMLAEHHRSLWRFAERRWVGARRLFLGPAAVFLAIRAGLTMVHHAALRHRNRAQAG